MKLSAHRPTFVRFGGAGAFARRAGSLRSASARRTYIGCLLAVISLYPRTTTAQQPIKPANAAAEDSSAPSTASREEIGRWITELGHDAFPIRQAAASRLLSAGALAREPLVAIADGPDPETRAAARRLVALIDKSEFHRRLEAFAADTDGRLGITLPGWDKFQQLVGGDPPARVLFVDMQRQEGALLAAVFNAPKRAFGDLLESRMLRVLQWQNTAGDRAAAPPLGSCAAMLFLGSAAQVEISDGTAANIEQLLQRSPSPILEALRSDNHQDPVRRLVVGWVVHCPSKNENILRQRLGTISALGLDEALPLALTVVDGEAPHKRVLPLTRALAVVIVGQLGRLEHVDRLEPLLEDASICQQQMQQAAAVQVRDVALIVMLQLTEQRPADYGYINARVQPPAPYQIQTLFRENDAQRAEAIAKWRSWRAAQKGTSPKGN